LVKFGHFRVCIRLICESRVPLREGNSPMRERGVPMPERNSPILKSNEARR
jgi:hypothetical protein